MRALTISLSLIAALILGAATVLLVQRHPIVISVDLGKNTTDAKAAVRVCTLMDSRLVTLKPGEPLVLEHRICPAGFHRDPVTRDNFPGFDGHHEVLLLEKKTWWRTQIEQVLFSEQRFTFIDTGKTIEGYDAVLWNYYIFCGSCHNGEEGLLSWESKSNTYAWHEDWMNQENVKKAFDAVLKDEGYLDEGDHIIWDFHRKRLDFYTGVHSDADAHCCPQGGTLSATLSVKDGSFVVSDVIHTPDATVK